MLGTLQRNASLFLGVLLLLAGFGLAGSLVSLRLAERGLTGWVGWVGAAYFVGLGLGSLRGEKTIARVGYLRAYGLLTSVACLAVLMMVLIDHPLGWLLGRTLHGFALGGLYVCIESWLGSSARADSRGTVLAIYQVVVYLGLVVGQALLGLLASAPEEALVWGASLVCLAALPVGMSTQQTPTVVVQPRLRLRELWGTASLGMTGAIVAGLTTGAIYTVAPAMGSVAGMSDSQVAWLMAAFIGGGVVLQLPLGRASDVFDRRVVLGVVSLLSIVGGVLSMALVSSPAALTVVAVFEGGWVFATYAIALAYTFDRVSAARAVSANAALLAMFCAASAIGASLSSMALTSLGPVGFYAAITLPSVGLAIAAFRAALIWDGIPVDDRGEVVLVPHTSPVLAELDDRIEVAPTRS